MRHKRETGYAIILTTVAILALLGFMGLAIDAGALRYEKRLQQTAADAAAIAGANNLAFGGVTQGAQDASSANSFADTSTSCSSNCPASGSVGYVTVTVNNPPSFGPHAAGTTNAGHYVEVLVSAVHPTYFMRALGIAQQTITARAVATDLGSGGGQGACMVELGAPTNAIQGFNITGSAVLNASPDCGIVDNGNYDPTGGALTVNTGSFSVSGGCVGSGCGKGSVNCAITPDTCPTLGSAAGSDPLAGTPIPCTSGYTCTGGGSISIDGSGGSGGKGGGGGSTNCGTGCSFSNGVYTIQPGTYSSISIKGANGGGSGCTSSTSVVFQPGVYIINGSGGFSETGNATLSGNGVTFYFTGAAAPQITGTPNIQLTAPSSGDWAGILMYEDPADTNTGPFPNGPTVGGDNCSNYEGALYFPNDEITFYGNDTMTVGLVVSKAVGLTGNPTVNLEGGADLPPGVNLIHTAVLVE